MMVGFVRREVSLLWQDFVSWRDRLVQRWHGVGDLFAGRRSEERAQILRYLRITVVLVMVFCVLYVAGAFIPVGFDWKCCFSTGHLGEFFVPWMQPIVRLFNPQSIFAITILALIVRMWRYRARPWRVMLAIISLPTLWLLFLGNVDGLVMVGLLLLPVLGVPLVLIKPQVASFALLSNRRVFVATLIWVMLSIVLWGPWPLNLLTVGNAQWRIDWPQDITLYPWGAILAMPLLWLSRGDEDMLMAAGSLMTPHLFPYHFYILMPALGRMRARWAILSWAISFAPLLANYWGPVAWHFGNLLSLTLWYGLFEQRRAAAKKVVVQASVINAAAAEPGME
jgi:hypothetical protein